MISISSIRTHMFCPMKLYLETHVYNTEDNDILLNIEIKKIKEKRGLAFKYSIIISKTSFYFFVEYILIYLLFKVKYFALC